MNTEPARLISLLNAAFTATLGVLTLVGVLDEKIAGGLGVALSAWVVFGGELIRAKVTPVNAAILTENQAEALTITPSAEG